MKNFTLLFALGLILLTSCSKDEPIEQLELQPIESVYVLNQFEGSAAWEKMLVDELENSADLTYPINNGVSAHTDGYYVPTSRDAMTITWSGTETRNGTNGSAEIRQATPNFSFHFVLETECVTVDGKEAVYGGIITQVRSLSGNAPNIGVGWRFYFKVIDNGTGGVPGGIIPYDQISNKTIFASPMSPSLCNAYLPNNQMWSSRGYTDVIEPGFVAVNQYSTN